MNNLKKFTVATLLLIVCFLLSLLSSGCHNNISPDPAGLTKQSPDITQQNQAAMAGNPAKSDNNYSTVVVYYFHRTMRCPTCLEIEKKSEQIIMENFAPELAAGTLAWKPFNLDEPGGEELEKQFHLSSSTLLIAKMRNGTYTKYKELEKVWQLIGNDVRFDDYVRTGIKRFLNE